MKELVVATPPVTYQGLLFKLVNLEASIKAGNKPTFEELEGALGTYEVLVNKWHDVTTYEGFALEDASRYIFDENLIRQELGELVKAMEEDDHVEVVDAILDVYWELIPVMKFLANFKELVTAFNGDDYFPHSDLNATGDLLCSLRRLSGDYKYLATPTLLKLLVDAHNFCRILLLSMLTPETLVRSLKEVVVSNFSKFIPVPEVGSVDYSLAEEVADVISLTSKKYNEEVLDNLTKVGDDVFLVLRNCSGKILKPEGLFLAPNLVLTSSDIANITFAISRSK